MFSGKAMTAFERVEAYRHTDLCESLRKSFSLIDRCTIIVLAV
ncbi:hypothetical protein T190_28490 [Sinorhizobium meliloti CCBAU 01290]|nr:hypothetical protein T190_28490 [Sinorhizobium meliloti CCBAU 01290]